MLNNFLEFLSGKRVRTMAAIFLGLVTIIVPSKDTLITDLGLLRLVAATKADNHWSLPVKNNSALIQATTLLSGVKNNQSAWKGLGFAVLLQGQEEQALIIWRNVHDMPELLTMIGLSLPPIEALPWLQRAATIEPQLSDNWFTIGQTYDKLENHVKAIEAYNRAVQVNIFDQLSPGELYCRLGKTYFSSLKQYDYALSLFNIALQLDNTASNFDVSECYRYRGEIYLRNANEIDKAIADFQQAILIYSHNHVAIHRLGIAYFKSGRLDLAERTILAAIDMWPNDKYIVFPYLTLGEIYQSEKNNTKAIAVYQKILTIDANNVIAKNNLCNLERDCDD